MRNSGYVRQVDSLGRLVLPIDLRKALGVQSGDSVEIFLDGDNKRVILLCDAGPQLSPGCSFCIFSDTPGCAL